MVIYLNLSNGRKIPTIGLETWLANDEKELSDAIEFALVTGYRHFDTAFIYGNEHILGQVLEKWIKSGKIRRDELFIVTKLPICGIAKDKVAHFLQKSLDNLKLDYVDMYLVHVPFGLQYVNDKELIPIRNGKALLDMSTNLEDVWRAMEAQVEAGKAKAIGISNFEESQVERIVKIAKIPPANLQVELHVYFQQPSLRALCNQHGIIVSAFAPFASPGRKNFYEQVGLNFVSCNLLNDEVVMQIAKTHGKTSSQILLRYLIQNGIAVIPKSTNSARIKENFQVFDFELKPEEMKKIQQLDKGPSGLDVQLSLNSYRELKTIRNSPEV